MSTENPEAEENEEEKDVDEDGFPKEVRFAEDAEVARMRQQSSQTNDAESGSSQWQPSTLPALALRTIPGYAGHLPGYRFLAGNVRHQMDKILASIMARSAEPPVEVPTEREVVPNPNAVFMKITTGERCRQPSTLLPGRRSRIPGYQGFVPKVRYSSAALGLRYSKAALNSLTETENSLENRIPEEEGNESNS